MTHILTERRDHILVVTMNRPEVRNAISREMYDGLSAAWEVVDSDPDIRVAILTGAGGAFCSGGDLKEMNAVQNDRADGRGFIEKMEHTFKATLRNYNLTKPLIAAVEGVCLAGGTEMLQATDIRIAGESARFGLPEVTHGLVPLAGSTVRLVRQIPFAKAMELLLTGKIIDAAEAKEAGLIGTIVPDGAALGHALEIARKIASNGPLAVQAIKRLVRLTNGLSEPEALDVELRLGRGIWDTADAEEGTRAFAERRKPRFTGR